MRLSLSNVGKAFAVAVITGGLALAAVVVTHRDANAKQYCATVGTSPECYPTLKQCRKNHRVCTRGPG
jgi:hypothetical protein